MLKSRKNRISIILLAVLLFAVPVHLSAQVSCEPGNIFYTIAEGWELRGVVDRLPSLRPYPLTVIRSVLNEVMEKGTEQDKAFAQSFYEDIFGKPWYVQLESTDTVKLVHGDDTTGNQVEVNPYALGDLSMMNDFLTVGYKVGFYNTIGDPYQFLQLFQNFGHDSIWNKATIGPFSSYLDTNTCIAFGNKNFYMQSGVYRTGFGPYLNEGLALNDSSYHSGNLSFHLNMDKWAYTQQLSVIGATTNAYPKTANMTYSKYLAFHAVDFYPTKKITLTYYETMVYGKRFDPSYLFPSPYMITQGITGYNDNLQMGIVFSYKPAMGFSWNTDLYIDHLSVDEIVKFNFNSENEIAVKTGAIYTPVNSLCSRLAIDYTLITPYMYSHAEYDDAGNMTARTFNYQNYTNNGICMGSSYPPNSDRISYTMDLQPMKRLHVQISSAFTRHANVYENFTAEEAAVYLLSEKGTYATDGSVFSNTLFADGSSVGTATDNLNFLTQSQKMYIIQAGISSDYSFQKIGGFEISLKLSYEFEYIKNKGVDKDIYEGRGAAVLNNDGTYTWNGTTYASADDLKAGVLQVAAQAKSLWSSSFYDVLENFISLGIVVKY